MKKILIISPDCWGAMKVSKMHFAMELSRWGDKVFFVNPPRRIKQREVCTVELLSGDDHISLIHVKENNHRVRAREKCYWFYKQIEKRYIRSVKGITGDVDQVWNFNPHFIINGNLFGAKKNILFMYDLFRGRRILTAAQNSDAIISIAQNILDYFKTVSNPKLLLQHGTSNEFINREIPLWKSDISHPLRIGYIGNLLRTSIEREELKQIILSHKEIEFHFWGAYHFEDNNLVTDIPDEETLKFIRFLELSVNVSLHGIKQTGELANEIIEMDGFVHVYSKEKDINAGSNAHKVMEYLSTGRVVISKYISQYNGTGLFAMESADGHDFPTFFAKSVQNLPQLNNENLMRRRIEFARSNSYSMQVDRVEKFLNNI